MLYSLIFGDYTLQDKFILVVCYLVSIYFAIVLHEIGHGLVAKWNGDDTARMMGRLSLNPLKHFEPIGMVMFVLVGIGWARPVPVNPNNFKSEKKGMVTVALAGVTVNLLLSFLSFGLYVGMGAIATKVAVDVESFWMILLKFGLYLGMFGTLINISLIAFNLLPLFPLDGFRLVEAFTKPNNKYVVFMRKYSFYIFIALIGLGIIADFTGWPIDVLGMYINAIRSLIVKLYGLILGV
ncbi:MAG: site-2 protease family protein [Clostridia bacterium]|nr:site-2 protease family protein [Clostridia bacterium]